ncbi:DNA topology modulation protein [Paenibacillus sp. OV219]|uniref:DNA topology modulation protein n=1 Tax=Paenibacillus sp. OV219 TaxID=1884377 RepID=UPI0008D1604D|nr:DNA topology modulation protein [Paenibacillus sp. OV219]SEO93863.1 Adenylate kinase [Paenibacillus sp. OV219]
MNRILIIGSPGSGKSTLAQKLGRIWSLHVIHLDAHFWKPNWVMPQEAEWDQTIERLTMQEQWIIDGNYSRTMDKRIERADLIILLDMPRWLCMYRIFKRRVMFHKKTRPDMNEGCEEKIDWAFVKWVWQYPKRSRMKTLNKLEQAAASGKQVIILQTRKQVKELLHDQIQYRVHTQK